MQRWYIAFIWLGLTLVLTSCTNDLQSQTNALTLSAEAVAQRQVQARRFDTKDEITLMRASAGVLQDLGFAIDEMQPELGMLYGSKKRDAVEAGQVVGAVVIAALFGVSTPIETTQSIKVSVVATPTLDGHGMIVRTSFQRLVWNSQNRVSRQLTITEPTIYRDFYNALSQSVFLQAHVL